MEALILCDEIDCQAYKNELARDLLAQGLKPKFVLRQHLSKVLDESKHLPPFLFYPESTYRIEHPKSVLTFHRKNTDFGLLQTSSGIPLSINPTKVLVKNDRPETENDSLIFTTSNISVERKLLPVTPPHIILIGHNREDYLRLTLNSLLFSLAENVSLVPLTLALVSPSSRVVDVAKQFKLLHPHIQMLRIEDNTHMATPRFVIKYLETCDIFPESILVMEDDFILPSTAKIHYHNWPWWFALRLQHSDLVAWIPSLENCPEAVQKHINRHKLNITRNSDGSRWLSKTNNFNLAAGGSAVAVKTETYAICTQRSAFGYPVDTELEALAANISGPTLFGYHIGWNQEQDGYGSLTARSWPRISKTTVIADLETGLSRSISL